MQPLIYLLATRSSGAGAHFRFRLVSLRVTKQFARFSAATFVSQFSALLISGLDLPIVAAFDFHNAGYYALAIIASNLLPVPFGAVLSTLVPTLSSMSAGEPAPRMGQVLLRTTRLATALLMLGAVPLMLGMPVLLRLWVGAHYAQHTLVLAEILVAASLVRLILLPYTLIAFSAGEQARTLVSPIVEAIVNVLFSLILAREIGAEGVAIGTLIGAFVGIALHFVISMPRTRSMAFSRANLLRQGILRPIGWSMGPAILLGICLHVFTSAAAQIALLGASVLALGAVFWLWHLDPGDRLVIRGAGVRLLPSRLRVTAIGA
jgi:O-antigen/teichoic acid export membrane protein